MLDFIMESATTYWRLLGIETIDFSVSATFTAKPTVKFNVRHASTN